MHPIAELMFLVVSVCQPTSFWLKKRYEAKEISTCNIICISLMSVAMKQVTVFH